MNLTTHPPHPLFPKVAREIRASHVGPSLAALAYDFLMRQGEARTRLSGVEWVQGLAKEHGVEDVPDIAGEDVLSLLERGPEGERQCALVAGLAVLHLNAVNAVSPQTDITEAEATSDGDGDDDDDDDIDINIDGEDAAGAEHVEPARSSSTLPTFVRHADWLEREGGYPMYVFVDAMLPVTVAGHVWDSLGDALHTEQGTDPSSTARIACRVGALQASSSPSAQRVLQQLAGHTHPLIRHLAKLDREPTILRVEGRVEPLPVQGPRAVLRWVTGWAVLVWCARLIRLLVGWRERAELSLNTKAMHVRREVRMLGRPIRQREDRIDRRALRQIARGIKAPGLYTVVGALALVLGVVFGGCVLFEGARSGETYLLLLGASTVALGVGADLLFGMIRPRMSRRLLVDLAFESGDRVCVSMPRADAEQFLQAVKERAN